VKVRSLGDDEVEVEVGAGEPWEAVVAFSLDEGLSGIECLVGIPGAAGATPVQNVGAYGQEVSQVITAVGVWDREEGKLLEMSSGECSFGYRSSRFKRRSRHVIVYVRYRLRRESLARPVRYRELARTLGIEEGQRAPLSAVSEAVMGLRRKKGMVLDPGDPDSRSAGSFFTNPVVDQGTFARLAAHVPDVPGFPTDGGVKVPAAWLIERAGFWLGYRRGQVGISSKHTLALVVQPGGTTMELLSLAREIRDGVRARFGVELEPEPVLVGVDW
jgi:UDP-N-acetylmuramate dehydrogenase